MLSRLIFGLALGLLMYMPRPRGETPPGTLPPGADGPPDVDTPPGDVDPPDWGPVPPVDDGPPIYHGDPPIGRHFPHTPSVPPTPPPGYEGEWPPAGERPDVPPTPPPGFEGDWPGEHRSIFDRIIELLRKFDGEHPGKRIGYLHAKDGAAAVGGAAPAGSDDVQGV
jgi:hypothetical protein